MKTEAPLLGPEKQTAPWRIWMQGGCTGGRFSIVPDAPQGLGAAWKTSQRLTAPDFIIM